MCTSTNEELEMEYPIYNEDTGSYLVEIYDNASLVADVKYYQVFPNSPLPVGEFEGIIEIGDVEYVYVIDSIVEHYEDDNGEFLKLTHKYRENFQEVFDEYGITFDDVDDIVESLIVQEEL